MEEIDDTRRREQQRTRPGVAAVGTRTPRPTHDVESARGRARWTQDELVAGVSPATGAPRARDLNSSRTGRRTGRRSSPRLRVDGAGSVGRRHGPTGVGKSSLVSALVGHARGLGRSIGVVSVDPSSPFTQGALLGDRIRLADHFLDPDVYIRSMGTRGHLGGLAERAAAAPAGRRLGQDLVFLETVGTGQSEVEVIGIADVVLLVLMPGSGDAVQALKAGIMRDPGRNRDQQDGPPAADTMLQEVRSIVALDPVRERRPRILRTEALRGEGVPELWDALESRRDELAERGELEERRRRNLRGEVEALAVARFRQLVERAIDDDGRIGELVEECAAARSIR